QVIANDATALDARVLLARYLYRQKKYRKSLELAESAVVLDPKDADMFGLIGNIHLRTARLRNAAKAFRRVLQLRPTSIPVRVNLGTVLFRLGEYRRASELYEDVLAKSKGNPALHYNLGSCYYQLKKWSQAITQLSVYLRSYDEDSKAHYFIGRAYAGKGLVREATNHLARATVLDEKNPWAPFALAELAYGNNDLETADTFAETALQRASNEPDILILAGMVARERGDFPRAVSRLEAAIPLAATSEIPRRELGMTFAISGRTNDAIDNLEAARTLATSDMLVSVWLSISRTHRALDHIDAGRHQAAQVDLERAIEVNPGALEAIWNLVLLHNLHEDPASALRVIQQALGHQAQNPDLHLLAAWTLARMGRMLRAQERLKFTQGAGDSGLRWMIQGAVHTYLGEFTAARIAFIEAKENGVDLGSALTVLELEQAADWLGKGKLDRALDLVVRIPQNIAPELQRVRAGLFACALLQTGKSLKRVPSLLQTMRTGPLPDGFGLERLARDTHLVTGWALYRYGRDEDAEKHLRLHLEGKPKDPVARRLMATVLSDRAERLYARRKYVHAERALDEAQGYVGENPRLTHNMAVIRHHNNMKSSSSVFQTLSRSDVVPEATLNWGLYLEDVSKRLNTAASLYRRYLKTPGIAAEIARNRLSRRQRVFGYEQ
ncbi:MAG: tetratricopeptide repeat protein, partial [Myxococcota bacterium]|nr:tetratricopeptide repeat protein [Myxococcota bacterium]